MQNTEAEFWVLSELITMQDRKVAMQAETLVWNARGEVDNVTLGRLVELISNSPTAIAFHEELPKLLDKIALEQGKTAHVIASEDAYKCRMQGPPMHGYVYTDADHALALRNYAD